MACVARGDSDAAAMEDANTVSFTPPVVAADELLLSLQLKGYAPGYVPVDGAVVLVVAGTE